MSVRFWEFNHASLRMLIPGNLIMSKIHIADCLENFVLGPVGFDAQRCQGRRNGESDLRRTFHLQMVKILLVRDVE